MTKIIKIILLLVLILMNPSQKVFAEEKIKIGLLVPLSGKNAEIGQSIIKATQLAINKINNPSIEIIPKDTKSRPETTLKAAKELNQLGVKDFETSFKNHFKKLLPKKESNMFLFLLFFPFKFTWMVFSGAFGDFDKSDGQKVASVTMFIIWFLVISIIMTLIR